MAFSFPNFEPLRAFAGSFSGFIKRAFNAVLWRLPKPFRSRTYGWAIVLIILYIILGALFAIPIYGFKLENSLTLAAESVFPFPAAIVDSAMVPLKSLHRQENFVMQFSERTGQPVEGESPRSRVLDQLIENKLVAKAAAKNHIKLSIQDVDKAFNQVIEQNGGEQEVQKVLKNLYNMSLSDFRTLIRAQLIKDKVREDLLVRVKARHILIADEARAKDVLQKALNGENWDELAKQFSEDTASRDKGGDLGFVNRGLLVKPFEDVAFSLEKGKINPELVKTEFGFHIIKAEDRNNGKIDKSYEDFLKDLKDHARIIKLVK